MLWANKKCWGIPERHRAEITSMQNKKAEETTDQNEGIKLSIGPGWCGSVD